VCRKFTIITTDDFPRGFITSEQMTNRLAETVTLNQQPVDVPAKAR
jgi:hypothetical protein